MDALDLDINNYTIKDLESFFKLNPKKKYTIADIELRETEIREVLLSSGNVNKRFKRDLLEFLETSRDWLIVAKCHGEVKKPTTFQNVPKLDPYPNFPAVKDTMPRTEELTVRTETPYINTFNSEYFQGTLNPLKTRTITKFLNIDTRFRDNLSSTISSNFMLNLPDRLTKVVSMSVNAFEFPVCFYALSQSYGNHFLNITVFSQMTPSSPIEQTDKTIIIPDGNYNGTDFIDKINSIMAPTNDDGTPIDVTDPFNNVQFRLDISETGSGTGKVILETVGNLAYTIKEIQMDFTLDQNRIIDKIEISSKIGWNLGFINRKYKGQTNYISEAIIEPANIRYIYLVIDDFNNSVNNNFISAFNKYVFSPNILARISIKGSYFSLMMETDLVSEPRRFFGPVDIQKLHIQVYDDHGRILDMNNSNFSFVLNIKMLYDI
jgi:hypothetical protein